MKKTATTIILFVLAACLLLTACGVPQSAELPSNVPQASAAPEQSGATVEDPPSATPTQEADQKWINADLVGNVTADMTVEKKDDYYTAVLQDWLATAELPEGEPQINGGTLNAMEIQKQVLAVIEDESQTGHEANLVQKYYNDSIDMETRNKRGVEPIMPQIKKIQDISSIKELTEYYTTDVASKMSYFPMLILTPPDSSDSQRYDVQICMPAFLLGDPSEYKTLTEGGALQKQAATMVFTTMLEKVGYSKADAAKTAEQMFEMEEKIILALQSDADPSNSGDTASDVIDVPAGDLEKVSPEFPLAGMLKLYTDAGVERFSIFDPEWLTHMNELYTEENLEGLKALLLYQVLDNSLMYLDQQALDLAAKKQSMLVGSEIKFNVADVAYKNLNTDLGMAVGKMYVENYVSSETKNDITKLVQEIVEVFRGRLNNADWMADETKAKALEKLDALKLKIAYPDDWTPYLYTELSLDEENGVWEDYVAIRAYNAIKNAKKVVGKVDKALWSTAPQVVNASYMPSTNSIEVYAGILTGDFYNKERSLEENLGGIGITIAHEITHAFDPIGSRYDKDGNRNKWWTEEDQAAFSERTDQVAQYFSRFELVPGVKVDGKFTIGESVADLGGVSCMLEIAKGIEGFNYNQFFESCPAISKRLILPMVAEQGQATGIDAHPPAYLRVNAILQQFPEFYEAVGVKEGDGMYLAPEERLAVW